MTRRALTINCGSSSLKVALFEEANGKEELVHRETVTGVDDHAKALTRVLERYGEPHLRPQVVGHRVVHGGMTLTIPTRIDASTLKTLDALVPLAPLHLPAEIEAIRCVLERWPDVPQVACFDTAFHRTMPAIAQRYALPTALLDLGIRRYGFHGLSYEYVVSSLGEALRPRTVVAHLGSGSSLAAIRDRQSVDTTMGFSPTGGVVMGTRPGDLDPAVVVHLLRRGISLESLDRMLERESGLLALSESTADVRKLVATRATDPYASFALDVFAASVRKNIGALATTLGGIDMLVFTGGIGENAAFVRAQIGGSLAHLGIEIDPVLNEQNHEGPIHRGACEVRIVHTDEERMVARHAFAVVSCS